jgi:hypothetical protein
MTADRGSCIRHTTACGALAIMREVVPISEGCRTVIAGPVGSRVAVGPARRAHDQSHVSACGAELSFSDPAVDAIC